MKKKCGTLLILVLCLVCMQSAWAAVPVRDDTGRFLNSYQVAELTQQCADIYAAHGIQPMIRVTSSLGEDLNRMRYYAADLYDNTYGNNSDGVIFLVAGRSYISVTTGRGETILSRNVLNAMEDDTVDYLRDGDYAGAFSHYLSLLDNVLTRYENGERFNGNFSVKTPIQRAVGILPFIAIAAAIITGLILLIVWSGMKTAKKKDTASEYAVGAELTRHSDVYLYTTTVRRRIQTSSGSGGSGHFSSSGGGHGSSSGGHF